MRIVFSCKWLSTFEHITKFCRPKKAIVAVWILLLSTLKISPIIASISLKLTSSYFSGPMLVIIVENKNLKQKKFQKIDKICRISVATFCVFGNFAATFWHSSKQVSSILRAPSGQACLWNQDSIKFLRCNLESWPLESGIQLKEFGIKLMSAIRNTSSND